MLGLSKEAEERLNLALETAVDAISAGETPTRAVAKAAAAHHVPPGHGRLLAQMYNIGQTSAQLSFGEDTREKAAAFELADPNVVFQELSGNAKVAAANAPAASYHQAPFALLGIYEEQRQAKIAGRMDKTAAEAPAAPARIPSGLAAVSFIEQQRNFVSHYKVAAFAAADAYNNALLDLVPAFRKEAAPTLATMRNMAAVREEPAVLRIVDAVAIDSPHLNKRAARQGMPTVADRAIYDKLVACIHLGEAWVKAAHEVRQQEQIAGEKIANYVSPLSPDRPTGPFAELNAKHPRVKQADMNIPWSSLFPGFAAGRAMPARGPGPDPAAVRGYQHAMDDPRHTQQLDAIRARADVETLMARDPVLQSYHPDDVLSAYNELSMAAPQAVLANPMYAGSMIRRILGQGGLDPSDVTTNVMKVENDAAKRRTLLPTSLEPQSRPPGAPGAMSQFVGAVSPFMPQFSDGGADTGNAPAPRPEGDPRSGAPV